MEVIMLTEKAARALDEMGRIPFNEEDIKNYIKDKFKKDIDIEKIKEAIDTLLISSDKKAPMRKCIYKEKKGGYSYLHACSFGVG